MLGPVPLPWLLGLVPADQKSPGVPALQQGLQRAAAAVSRLQLPAALPAGRILRCRSCRCGGRHRGCVRNLLLWVAHRTLGDCDA